MQNEQYNKLFLEAESLEVSKQVENLFEQQIKNWPLATGGYSSLASVEVKKFEFDNFSIEAHFNPGRIISSSAKVDSKSIKERLCFLCPKNLPADQKAIRLIGDYLLLVNPFPIFNKHFTIPTSQHTPQQIKTEIENVLTISSMLGKDYSVFYNGPKCGASAPDHLHFQAGNFGFMNIDNDFAALSKSNGKVIFETNDLRTSLFSSCLRNFVAVESNNISAIVNEFAKIYSALSAEDTEEPLMNLICTFENVWRLLVFPRSKHRPTFFFEEGEKKILISPAAVDMGGVLIFPREEDFAKVTRELIVEVFRQVTFSDIEFQKLADRLTFGKG
ncbi:MAG: Glycosyltransferase [Ignavibacteria bacterium]|nr:MAG: Glycosyltransferase [Ignavibacteria bacterium]KAF0161804.1 MAG: Glycosyltransferase [Ignavibacteria bacterium]